MDNCRCTELFQRRVEDGGVDIHYEIKLPEGEKVSVRNQDLRDELEERFHYASSHPGSTFCNSYTLYAHPYFPNEGIVVVHQRLDI